MFGRILNAPLLFICFLRKKKRVTDQSHWLARVVRTVRQIYMIQSSDSDIMRRSSKVRYKTYRGWSAAEAIFKQKYSLKVSSVLPPPFCLESQYEYEQYVGYLPKFAKNLQITTEPNILCFLFLLFYLFLPVWFRLCREKNFSWAIQNLYFGVW